jgi:hypothetical protein
MKLTLNRNTRSAESTIGDLLINDEFFCYVLEDFDRGLTSSMSESEIQQKKVYAKTAIPKGTYKVVITFSPRFKQYMPLLLNVKGFIGIRIHTGNVANHSEGCLILGMTKSTNFVGQSKIAYSRLMAKLKKVEKTEEIIIEIK